MMAPESRPAELAPGKAPGKTKWKNKIKNFLTSPLPSSKPIVASTSRESTDSFGEVQTRAYSNDLAVSESYEARLSKLVGDLEEVDYGSTFRSFGDFDSSQPFSALTPTNFSDLQAGIGVDDALSAYTAFGDYSFNDILVPALEDAPTPSTSTPVTSAPLTATGSGASTASGQSQATSSDAVVGSRQASLAPGRSASAQGTSPLFLGDLAGTTVPFNSPADGIPLQGAGIASLSMPFSFDDLKGMGLIEGGGLDMGGGKEDDEFADLLRLSQIGGPYPQDTSTDSKDSGLGMGSFNLNLFPLPGVVPSPVTDASGPSPALSYGESSGTSNTSFEELAIDANSTLRPSASSKGLFSDPALLAKAYTHTPRASVTSLPPTPASYHTASSVPTSPHRPRPLPKVHASALQWRVAPTQMSPKSSIVVSPGRPVAKSPSFVGNDVYTSPSRLGRINTASSPELKRRRESEDVQSLSIDAMLAGTAVTYSTSQQGQLARPIAGRRRVAGKMASPPLRQSHSQHQLYQPAAPMPQLPVQTAGWMTPQVLRSLYTQLDVQTFLCALQGCRRTFGSALEVEAHVQRHFASTQPQVQQQGLWV